MVRPTHFCEAGGRGVGHALQSLAVVDGVGVGHLAPVWVAASGLEVVVGHFPRFASVHLGEVEEGGGEFNTSARSERRKESI